MLGKKFEEKTLKTVDSFENYINNPKKYNVITVSKYVKTLDDDKVKLVASKDNRIGVQNACRVKLAGDACSLDVTNALTMYYGGRLSKSSLKEALGSDGKYIDQILKRYRESRARNEAAGRFAKCEVQPKKRLHNIKWVGAKVRLTKSMFISPYVTQIIERGIYK